MHADAGSSHELNASGKNEPPLDESWLRAWLPNIVMSCQSKGSKGQAAGNSSGHY